MTRLRGAFDRARVDAGVTYAQVADATGESRRTLLDIATGRSAGTLRTWALIARALGTTIDELVAPIWADPHRGPDPRRASLAADDCSATLVP
jgi:transcriptional regulator with XRE-family HTH domain